MYERSITILFRNVISWTEKQTQQMDSIAINTIANGISVSRLAGRRVGIDLICREK